jgi:hypothetical protein
MNDAIGDVRVDDYQALMGSFDLPDPDDRHVLAAAIQCGAQSIITHNLKDFPAEKLEPYGVEAIPPEVRVDLLDLAPGAVLRVLNEQQASLKSPPRTLEELIDTLESNGLTRRLAALVSECLKAEPVFEDPPLGAGPQVLFGDAAEVPAAGEDARRWVATMLAE